MNNKFTKKAFALKNIIVIPICLIDDDNNTSLKYKMLINLKR